MDISIDQPTIRIQLDALIKDHQEFSASLAAKQQEFEQLRLHIQQYHGALEYNRVLQAKLQAVLAAPVSSPSA